MKGLPVLLVLLLVPVALAGAATTPKVTGLTAWAGAGSRLAFVAGSVDGRRGYLWTQSYGAGKPRLLRATAPIGEEEVEALAAGPNGVWAALEATVGNTGSYYSVDVVSSRGGGAQVAKGSTPMLLVGDGSFLGYLTADPAGADLYRIRGARGIHVARLAGVSAPQEVVAASGHFAVRDRDGSVSVFTDGGARLATILVNAASVATTADRVVVRTRGRRLVVYGLRGGLVHDWPLAAGTWTAGLAAYGGRAVYLGANKALHSVRLANGADRVVARAGSGFFLGGVALQKTGALAPLTSGRTTVFRFIPAASL